MCQITSEGKRDLWLRLSNVEEKERRGPVRLDDSELRCGLRRSRMRLELRLSERGIRVLVLVLAVWGPKTFGSAIVNYS